jgi:tRNA U54 and U55 pseudouridine synthase Pus10
MWATDLLPDEIDQVEPELFDESRDSIYFIGTPNGQNILEFKNICERHGKYFRNPGGWSGIYSNSAPDINQNIQMVRDSYISVDIRDAPHLVQGRYYPCRLFKNISYGRWTGSNHPEIADVFGEHFTTDSNLENLYQKLVEDSRNCTEEKMRSAMSFIRDGHTYVSRLKDMFAIL